MAKTSTSWQQVGSWYGELVGEEGHYHHRHQIFPKLLPLLNWCEQGAIKLLDLACGEGVLARQMPPNIAYVGVDAAPSLIQRARSLDKEPHHRYLLGDITQPITALPEASFTHATIILALQNIAAPLSALQNAQHLLTTDGRLILVLNHPCFRIPRQSHWGVDAAKKLQYRRIDRYMTAMEIPIQMHPGKNNSPLTTSFHHPLSTWAAMLYKAGFLIELLEEWCSDKASSGRNKKMEDRSREEFPLFLAIRAVKKAV